MDPVWEYVADGMMGGMSRSGMQRQIFHGREAVVLQGDVSLDNTGGFVKSRLTCRLMEQVSMHPVIQASKSTFVETPNNTTSSCVPINWRDLGNRSKLILSLCPTGKRCKYRFLILNHIKPNWYLTRHSYVASGSLRLGESFTRRWRSQASVYTDVISAEYAPLYRGLGNRLGPLHAGFAIGQPYGGFCYPPTRQHHPQSGAFIGTAKMQRDRSMSASGKLHCGEDVVSQRLL